MPAVEQTYRDTKWMHKIFGVSSVVMLIATIWMFAADHSREWKPVQRTSDHIDASMTAWRKFQYEREESVRARNDLKAQVTAARRMPIPKELLDEFGAEVHSDGAETKDLSLESLQADAEQITANAGKPEAEEYRERVLERMRKIARDAKFSEEKLLGQRKFKSAARDAAVANLGLMVRDGKSKDEQDRQQNQVIDRLTDDLSKLTADYQKAKQHRVNLDRIIKEITKEEDAAAEELKKTEGEITQIDDTVHAKTSTYVNWWYGVVPLPGKRVLEMPILDAFNSPRKIDNLWSKGLEIDYNFDKVRRYDRCTTCHQAMQKTMPGSAIDPAYSDQSMIDFQIVMEKPEGAAEPTPPANAANGKAAEAATATAAKETAADTSNPAASLEGQLDSLLGFRIATEGLINRQDATVQFIRPETPASKARAPLHAEVAKAAGDEIRKEQLTAAGHRSLGQVHPGILVGDVIVAINGDPVTQSKKAITRLLDAAAIGKNFTITVRRGLPNPYTSHPRLDLFVGSLSPHKMSEFACTVCHDGQGSATAFKYASHTPTTEQQRKDWAFEHGWFDNHHWPFPMYPERFVESACLKCHHTVTELEWSPQYAETPAPKVTHGYHLIRKFGCYGCHEINGYDGKKRIGPDLRLEPNFFGAALQLQADPGFAKLSPEEQDWVQQVVEHPDRDLVRHRVLETLDKEAQSKEPRLSPVTLSKLTPLLRDIESPGTLRKAGPSLRYVGAKNDSAFLYDWIREPKHFRPSTRMPQFSD